VLKKVECHFLPAGPSEQIIVTKQRHGKLPNNSFIAEDGALRKETVKISGIKMDEQLDEERTLVINVKRFFCLFGKTVGHL